MTDPAPELKTPLEHVKDPHHGDLFYDADRTIVFGKELAAAYNALSADLAKLRAERDDAMLVAWGLAEGHKAKTITLGHIYYSVDDEEFRLVCEVNDERDWKSMAINLSVLTPEARAVLAEAMKLNQGEAK